LTISGLINPVSIEIFNTQGSKLLSQEVCPNEKIKLFDLSNGLYTVSILNHINNLKIHSKLIIAR
jgi:hypothetical protein